MRSLLESEEFDFRFEVGICDLTSNLQLTARDRIVQSLATHYTVVRVKAQLDQMIEGLHTLGIYEVLKANPHMMQELFLSQPKTISSDFMLDMFDTRFSPDGSNRREDEEQVVMYWCHFIEMIECKE